MDTINLTNEQFIDFTDGGNAFIREMVRNFHAKLWKCRGNAQVMVLKAIRERLKKTPDSVQLSFWAEMG